MTAPPPPPAAHALGAPSPWITRWSHLLPSGCTVLDVACGSGRHLQWFAARGHPVLGVDRDIGAAQALLPGAQLVQADIENGPWPLATPQGPRPFGAVVVTNYLWRPLLPTLLHSLAPGGLLLYETFAAGNETVGRPARPDFLLQPGELLQLCSGLQVVAYENGFLDDPARFVQRIAAFAPALPVPGGTGFSRHPL
ncbi:MAG: class I SAM-dependent methyltransferase [Rhodoferax sp.]|nr:class I SAM-dependent methyltransferase [Rhodoferax sp.]